MALSPKRQRFVEEYMVDLNATRAAIRAGYSERSADTQASRLLRNVKVAAAIEAAQEELTKKTGITSERVLKELALVGFAHPGEYFEWGPDGVILVDKEDLTPEQMVAVAEVAQTKTQHGGTIRLKLHDKVAALSKIGQHLGMFTEKYDHHVGGKLTIEIIDPTKD